MILLLHDIPPLILPNFFNKLSTNPTNPTNPINLLKNKTSSKKKLNLLHLR